MLTTHPTRTLRLGSRIDLQHTALRREVHDEVELLLPADPKPGRVNSAAGGYTAFSTVTAGAALLPPDSRLQRTILRAPAITESGPTRQSRLADGTASQRTSTGPPPGLVEKCTSMSRPRIAARLQRQRRDADAFHPG